MTPDLADKTAIVTGAASGQGREEAKLFAEAGANTVLTDIDTDRGQAVADEIDDDGGEATFLEHDVSEEDEWEAVVESTLDAYGGVDVLMNNAGTLSLDSITEESVEGWQHVIDVDQKGVWLGMKHAIPPMLENGGGSIINTSSIWGVNGVAGAIAYQAAKGAVRQMTKAAAVEFGADGIRVNSLHPGFIETAMTEGMDDVREEMVGKTPMDRAGRPEEVAEAALFLASDRASYVNGAEINVDGGFLAE